MRVERVPPGYVDLVWAHVLPMVERGLRHTGGFVTEDIRRACVSGDMLLWAVRDGADIAAVVVLDVLREQSRTIVYVVLIAGRDFKSWAPDVQALIRDFADLVGADGIEATVRDGMTKWLRELGWRRKLTVMELPNG